jgi:hypothetical protein
MRVGRCCSDPSGTPRGIPPAARPGGFVYVLAYLSQKEINLSNNAESSWVVVRGTPQPIVVILTDDYLLRLAKTRRRPAP